MRRESPTPSTFADLSLRSDPPPSSSSPASPASPGAVTGSSARPRLDETPRPRLEDPVSQTGNRLRWDDTPRVRNTDNDPLDLPLFEPGQPPAGLGSNPAAGTSRTPSSTPPPSTPPSSGRTPASVMTSASASPLDDRPLVSATLPPRPPLSVRRRTAEGTGTGSGPRPRVTPQAPSSYGTTTSTTSTTSTSTSTTSSSGRVTPASRAETPSLELDFSDPSDAAGVDAALASDAATSASELGLDASTDTGALADTAPLGSRLFAGAIDIAFMALVELIVLHFTFRLTGLSFGDWRRLPLAPLIGFLALLHGGYLTMFTAASGQTMGKMIAKIKVVTMQGGAVPFGTAVVRAFVWLVTAPIVVGLIPALISDDHRALHDRFADTRVIKAE